MRGVTPKPKTPTEQEIKIEVPVPPGNKCQEEDLEYLSNYVVRVFREEDLISPPKKEHPLVKIKEKFDERYDLVIVPQPNDSDDSGYTSVGSIPPDVWKWFISNQSKVVYVPGCVNYAIVRDGYQTLF